MESYTDGYNINSKHLHVFTRAACQNFLGGVVVVITTGARDHLQVMKH